LVHAQTFFRGVGKPTGKIHFSCLRVRSASLADTRMRICYNNNGGSSILKRAIVESTLWLPQETAAVDKTMHSILPQCQ
jgi:hypothetical protein